MKIVDIKAKITGRSDGGDNPIATERELWEIILNECCKLYQVIEIDVNVTANPEYMSENWDNTGLGINDMDGFALCNGNNGTRDRTGKVAIGYGSGYATIGSTGGSKDAVVVSHKHKMVSNTEAGGDFSPTYVNLAGRRNVGTNVEYILQGTAAEPLVADSGSSGVDGTNKNMMPYIITLMAQRIS